MSLSAWWLLWLESGMTVVLIFWNPLGHVFCNVFEPGSV